ncbi:MAG: hypothetical protein WKF77_16190 [Planctomycetaceae bacterium]
MAGMPAGYAGGVSPVGGAQSGVNAGDGYAGGQVAAKTPRPDTFDAWTDADFVSAAREHDPRVLDAIDFKVKSAPGDGSVAVLLTSLLDLPPSPTQTSPIGAASGYPGMNGATGSGSSIPGSSYPGSSYPGTGSSGSSPPPGSATMPPGANATPVPGTSGSAPISSPRSLPSSAPQSSLGRPKNEDVCDTATDPRGAIDSVSAMILEAAVTYMPQGAAVGAVSGAVPGRLEGLAGQAPGNYQPPGGNSAGAMPPGYPGGGNPSGEYPGSGYATGDGLGVNGPSSAGQLQDRLLVSKVVDGLIANNSQEAWQSVFGIVAGTVKTPLPAVASCEIVVERLVQNMDSNPDVIQPVLLAFLDNATQIPPASRTACMRMLAAISATQTDQLTGFAMTETPPAAAPGGISGFPGAATNGSDLAGAGSAYPGMAGAEGYPGMSGPNANAAVTIKSSLPQVTLDPDVAAKGANFLWSPKTIDSIISQLGKTTDLTAASDVLLLASTIPGAVVRNAIYETFMRLHPSGSDGLNASGLFSDVHDPGVLVILKALPRIRPSKEASGTMDSWTSGTESLVLALRDELKRTCGSMKPYTDTLPVKLHKNATAEVAVMMQIPAGTTEPSPDAIPAATTVYYTRTSFTPQKKRDTDDLTAHYEGRTSGYSRPDMARGVMWIEGVKALPNGHRRTLDVIIQKGGASGQMGFSGGPVGAESGYGGGGASGSYTVEIIVVDTVDPKTASPAASTQAEASP